ncbi:hypothetical protein XENOCAPTIV_021439, partial [Xenoophorus captivus]
SLFLLPEIDSIRVLPSDHQVAVEMCGASLGWEGVGHSAQPSPCVQVASRYRQREKCTDSGILQDEEEPEEVTGSLLGGGGADSSPEEEDGDEEDTCPPLLAVPRTSLRPQSTLHCITLSVQQGQLLGVCGCVGSMFADDGAGGQRGRQRKDGLRSSAGLDSERDTERQHPVWTGVPGGQVKRRHVGFRTKMLTKGGLTVAVSLQVSVCPQCLLPQTGPGSAAQR